MPKPWYCWQGKVLTLNIRVQPRASRNEITGPAGDYLKIRLTTPPVDGTNSRRLGEANQHLLGYLAKTCGVSKNRVELLSGTGARIKRVSIVSPKKLPEGVPAPEL